MKHLRLMALIGLMFGLVAYSYAQENGEASKTYRRTKAIRP